MSQRALKYLPEDTLRFVDIKLQALCIPGSVKSTSLICGKPPAPMIVHPTLVGSEHHHSYAIKDANIGLIIQ